MRLINIAIQEQESKQRMKVWMTYINLYPRTACSPRGGSVAAGGEGSLDLREVPLRLETPSKAGRTSMRLAGPRQHHRHLVDRLGHRVLHLWMELGVLLAVSFLVLFGLAVVHLRRGPRLVRTGRHQLHVRPRFHLTNFPPELLPLHHKTNVTHIIENQKNAACSIFICTRRSR